MATVFSGGTYVDTTFTGDTKLNIANNLLTQLLKAGWSVISGALAPPGAPTIVGSGSGGTLAAATYLYAVTAVNATGETTIGTASSSYAASGSTSSVALSSIPIPSGATQRKIYRSTDGGVTWGLIHTLADNTTTTYTDAGDTASTAPPTINTTPAAAPNILLETAQDGTTLNRGRVRLKDNSGTCIEVSIENHSGGQASTSSTTAGAPLLPAAAKTWRVMASKYRFEVYTPGASAAREFACAGILWIPTPYQGVITEAIYMAGNAASEADSTTEWSFRNVLYSAKANCAGICNGSLMQQNNDTSARSAAPHLRVPGCGQEGGGSYNGTATIPPNNAYRWHDLALDVADPLMAWGLSAVTDEALIRGQPYDWTFVSDSFAADTTDSWTDGSSHNFRALTVSNIGSVGSPGSLRGTVWVATS